MCPAFAAAADVLDAAPPLPLSGWPALPPNVSEAEPKSPGS
jgi:hypothetical protein